jgi:AmmeMemoRadiSam system protein A
MLSDDERAELLGLARRSIAAAFRGEDLPRPRRMTPALGMKTGAFVTLHKAGRLRGCIGTFGRDEELWRVVAEFARNAAFRDGRFPQLAPDELAGVAVEISVLSPLRKLDDPLDIRMGKDGIWIVGANGRTGTYLPQVAEHFGTKEEFLSHCSANKAGLSPGAWRDPGQATVYAYTAEVFGENEKEH